MKKIVSIFLFTIICFAVLGQSSDGMALKAQIPYTTFDEKMTRLFFGFYDKEGEQFIFNGKSKSKGWMRYTWDPISRKITSGANVEEQFEKFNRYDVLGYETISPNGKYLVVDRTWKPGVVLHDLETNSNIIQEGKIRETSAAYGVSFISNDQFYMLNHVGDGYQPTSHLLQKINVSDLSVEEEFDLGLYETDVVRPKGGTHPSKKLTSLAYSPFSPYKHPILVFANYSDIYLMNEQTKEIVNTINLKYYGGGGINATAFGNIYLSPLGNYLLLSKTKQVGGMKFDRYLQIFDVASGNLVFSKEINWKDIGVYVSDVTEEIYTVSLDDEMVRIYSLPRVLQGEFEYLDWLRECDQKKDSIAAVASSTAPKFNLNSPDNDWVYLGEQGAGGMANGIGDAIRKDGMRFIKNGLFIEGEFVAGKMENVYGVTMEGEFKGMKLNGFGRHVTENKAILEGEFTEGVLNGQGESIDPSGLTYVGTFKNGGYDGKGKITRPDGETFDGEFLAGKPHGNGLYMNGDQVERAEYYQGRRIDQAYLMRIEREKMERERKLAELKEQQRQQYLAQQQKKKSSNKLFGAALMGLGAGVAGSSAGMDAMQSMEFGTAMMQDVMSGGTSNLDQFKGNMNAQFAAQRASYQNQNNVQYQQKAQENNCNLSDIYEGPDGGQGGAYCAQATLMKCHGKMDRVAQLCKLFKQVTNETCPVCN